LSFTMSFTDTYGRPLKDLRISVTDRCNFRCQYCMPREHFGPDHAFLAQSEILQFEEITLIVNSLLEQGLQKIRITGGEPLIRRDITKLIEMLRSLSPTIDIALTTNGALLSQFAQALAEAGLNRVTVSLDALDQSIFHLMADTEHIEPEDILSGIQAAKAVGLKVKINTVIQKGTNQDQIVPLTEYAINTKTELRFIEFMDVGNTNEWNLANVMTGEEIRTRLHEKFGALQAIQPTQKSDVARLYSVAGGGTIGFIESISNPFCGDCSRARISANGHFYTCLFSNQGHDIKSLIRMGATREEIADAIQSIWAGRTDRYSDERRKNVKPTSKVEMSFIGG